MIYSTYERIVLIHLIIICNIFYAILLISFVNFTLDSKNYNLDNYKFTRLSTNYSFSACDLIDCINNLSGISFMNFIICIIFSFQSLIFISNSMLEIFTKRATGIEVLVPKIVGRIIFSFSTLMQILLYQPSKSKNFPQLDLSDYIRYQWFYLPLIYGIFQFIQSLYFNLIMNDELNLKLLLKLIKNEDIPKPTEYIYTNGIYMKIRHPLKGSLIIIFVSLNTQWDIGKIIYSCIWFYTLFKDSFNEDEYYYQKTESYKKYYSKVKNRFFNFNFLISDIISKESEIQNLNNKSNNNNAKSINNKKEICDNKNKEDVKNINFIESPQIYIDIGNEVIDNMNQKKQK